MSRALHLVLLLSLACAAASRAGEARINSRGEIEAPGRDIRVFRGEAVSALFGKAAQDGTVCRFSPTVPLVAGEAYRVEFQGTDGSWRTERLRFEKAKIAPTPTVRLAPFPALLPANALKLYLHFSEPMEQGVFLERISLHRQDESLVQGAFRETELWSPDGRRLTLWLHPGRQKTGVNLNRDEGPVLVAGEKHFLKISGQWRSAAGVPLGTDVSFTITAGESDHACPDPARWQLQPPQAGTRMPLVLTFDEPLDPAMLASALKVKDGKGTAQVSGDARTWSWLSARPWTGGSHTLEIDPLLEDLAGNNLTHPFEVDRERNERPKAARTTITFDVR